ncbi:hypothetical protein I6F36_10660 [Bradyrhizobium sp. BRP19]|uniref:hypothetical protein n=1 Tax=Bradyrhizobium sp. BRP19 TaxID=2793823 RepID=UPI001CD58E79|nr:hypothetical protein [Bradyrhizobium sp. BRP19]MCA1547274.1 hypothetical protein [Bradyrhizobium sp. BRP19]
MAIQTARLLLRKGRSPSGDLSASLPSGHVVRHPLLRIRAHRIDNEFLPRGSMAEILLEDCRGHEMIVLRPTPDMRRAPQHPKLAVTHRTIALSSVGVGLAWQRL